MHTFMGGWAAAAAVALALALPAQAETVSFDLPPAHVDFVFNPIQLTSGAAVALPDGSWAQAVSGSNDTTQMAVNVQQTVGDSWTTYGYYTVSDGLTAQRFLGADGSSRLALTLTSYELELGSSGVTTLKLDYACDCTDLYKQPLNAFLLQGRTPVSGSVITDYQAGGSTRDPEIHHWSKQAVFAVPEPQSAVLLALGLLMMSWRARAGRARG